MFAQVTAVGHQLSEYGVPHDGYCQHPNCLIGWTHRQWLHVQCGLDMFVFLTKSINMDFATNNAL